MCTLTLFANILIKFIYDNRYIMLITQFLVAGLELSGIV